MIIRIKQLDLFNQEKELPGGVEPCGTGKHDPLKPARAKWLVTYKNGNQQYMCGRCVKKYQEGGPAANRVAKVERIK